jgi:hypothetical protein
MNHDANAALIMLYDLMEEVPHGRRMFIKLG